MAVGDKQSIKGEELHQVIVKSIINYVPKPKKTVASKFLATKLLTRHRKVTLGVVLDNFVQLKYEPLVQKHDEPLELLEETIRKHYADGVEGEPDTRPLQGKVMELHHAYEDVLQKRTTERGRIKKWLRVIREGNDSFRKVYDNVWEQV